MSEHKTRRTPLILVILAATSICTTFVYAQKPGPAPVAPPQSEENWYVVTLQDQPCGFMHGTMKTVGDEVHSETITQIEIKRGAATVKMRMEQSSRETIDGKPLSFRHVQQLGNVPQTIEGTVKDGKIILKESQFQSAVESTYDFDPQCRFAWGQLLENRRHGLEPGTKYTLKSYEPSLKKDGPIDIVLTVSGKETLNVLGESRSLHRMTSSMKIEPTEGAIALPGEMSIDSDVWIDDDYTPIIMTVDLGIMKMKMYQTTKEKALETGAPPEMFLQTLIAANKTVPADAKTTKYRVSMKPGSKAVLPNFPDTEMQSFKRTDDRSGIITVRRMDWDALKAKDGDELKAPADISDRYLIASSVCDASDRTIRRLAIRACKADAPPTTKADKLRRFITDYISDKGMDVGFATATEVARDKRGDCTEHGVLLAAVARAAGIPSRGVGGLVGVPAGFRPNDGGVTEFGFHMWTQVYINGKWTDIDAAMRQTECDTTHIAITLIPLGNEGLMGEVWSIIPLLGQLDIEIIE